MTDEKRNMWIGVLATLAFHLILLVSFLSIKLDKVKSKHRESIVIEFDEQEYKTIEEIINNQPPDRGEIEKLSDQTLSNIVSDVSEEINKEISTDKYIEEVMKELGIEELDQKHSNDLPDDPVYTDKQNIKKEEINTNFGPTRIEVNIPPRKARYVYRPIYKCEGGGTVVIRVAVNPDGEVIQASIQSTTTNESCVNETALESARNTLVTSDYNSNKKLEGTIKYIFVAQ